MIVGDYASSWWISCPLHPTRTDSLPWKHTYLVGRCLFVTYFTLASGQECHRGMVWVAVLEVSGCAIVPTTFTVCRGRKLEVEFLLDAPWGVLFFWDSSDSIFFCCGWRMGNADFFFQQMVAHRMVSVQKIFQNVLQNINLHQRCAWEWKEQTSAASSEHTRKMWWTSRGCNRRADISLGVPWETGGVVMFWAHCRLLWSAGTSSSKVCYLGIGHKNACSGSHHESGALGPIWEGTAHTHVCVSICVFRNGLFGLYTLCQSYCSLPLVCLGGLCQQDRIKSATGFANNSETRKPPKAQWLFFFQCFPTGAK